jgi:glucose/arabinose dehydrogenase
VRVNLDGSRTVIASTGLTRPGGVARGPDGSLYVTINSASAGDGAVVRIVP